MKETKNISLAGSPVIIDEDAYKKLKQYLDKLALKFKGSDLTEIQKDVEVRILELLHEQKWNNSKSISEREILKVIDQIGEIDSDSDETNNAKTGSTNKSKRLFRDQENGQIFGICQGLGEYFGVDPVWFRLLFIALAFITSGVFIAIYIFAGFIIPEAKTEFDRAQLRGKPQDLKSILNNLKDENKTQQFLKNTDRILRKTTTVMQKAAIIGTRLCLQLIRFFCLAITIFILSAPMIFIWSNRYQEELNIFLTPLNLSEKIGFSLLALSTAFLFVLGFLALTKMLGRNKSSYKFKLSSAFAIILVLIVVQLPPAILWVGNFTDRNQNWELMSDKYFTHVQYKKELSQPKLNIEANGKFIYIIEFSDDNTFSLDTNIYKDLENDFKLEVINQNEAKLTSPPYTKILEAKNNICLTCSKARFSPEDGSAVSLINLKIPRSLKSIEITNNLTDFTVNTQFIVHPDILSAGLISNINNGDPDYENGQFIIINQKTNETVYPKFFTNQ